MVLSIINIEKMIDGGENMRLCKLDERCNISGERVRQARKQAGMSQEVLAAKLQLRGLQMGQMAVSRIETGKRVIPDFEVPILADALGVTVNWLLGLAPEMKK